jgi:hypothetical protein
MDFLDRFAETLEPSAVETLAHIRDFIAWQSHREGSFVPTEYDDIPARTYLLELKTGGMSSADQRSRIAALRRFYAWSVGEGLLSEDPLQIFSVERPRLTREQIRRRRETLTGTAEERQIARLRILNQLFDQLNRSTDVQTALSTALESIVSLLDLRTGWAFLLPHATEPALQPSQIARGDFRLCAACALPPGLEADNRYFLNNAKHCHCTATLAAGRMQRAVNIVECTACRNLPRPQAIIRV